MKEQEISGVHFLVYLGYSVLEIVKKNGNELYIIDKFNQAIQTSTTSNMFNTAIGVYVNPFLTKNIQLASNKQTFSDFLNKYLNNTEPISIEFSQQIPYTLYRPI